MDSGASWVIQISKKVLGVWRLRPEWDLFLRIRTVLEAIMRFFGVFGIGAGGTEVSRFITIFLLLRREFWGVWRMLVPFSGICFFTTGSGAFGGMRHRGAGYHCVYYSSITGISWDLGGRVSVKAPQVPASVLAWISMEYGVPGGNWCIHGSIFAFAVRCELCGLDGVGIEVLINIWPASASRLIGIWRFLGKSVHPRILAFAQSVGVYEPFDMSNNPD
jgi:hypothetical protein